ncbi:MAG: OmpA/MotB family protein [Armatimonadota bacterium]
MTLSRRERHEEEHGHDERWLITYADMITLLLAVFIVLYSFSVLDLRKFETVASALGNQFHGSSAAAALPGGGDGILSGGSGIACNRAALVSDIKSSIERNLPERLTDSVTITLRGDVVTVSVKADSLTFPVGEARLTEELRQILDVLGPSLSGSPTPLLVAGHTCDLPINTGRFPSNWELSAQRATNVMVHLIRHCGINPDDVASVGYADTRPMAANDSEANRVRNRRVDIIVLSAGGQPAEGTMDSADAAPADDDLRLRPVRIRPTIDLRARYYQHTGRRSVDAPASETRREVQ